MGARRHRAGRPVDESRSPAGSPPMPSPSTDDKQRRAALNLARRGESAAGVAGALTLAGTEAGIVVTPDDLDADPFLLNCPNGTLDLRTGELRAHDPADLITKMTGAALRPGRRRPRVHRVPGARPARSRRCATTSPGSLGHALEGRVLEHILPIFHGDGAQRQGHLHRRGAGRARRLRRRRRPRPAQRPDLRRPPDRRRRPVRPAAGGAARNRPRARASPRAPSSGSPAATGSRPGGCARTSGTSSPPTPSSC